MDNYTLLDAAGKSVTIVYAESAEKALAAYPWWREIVAVRPTDLKIDGALFRQIERTWSSK